MVNHWQKFTPSDGAPWNLRRVHHLHRRAGFGANWAELQRDLNAGPDAAIDRILDAAQHTKRAVSETDGGDSKVLATSVTKFESLQQLIGDAAVTSGEINRLEAWWFYRMLYSGDPLTERMTLMWHNHFATSNLKVQNIALMKRQNDKLRTHALSKFGELLPAVVKDAAMMVWLDAKANRKEQPNENLARELMELFTLGAGHYSETDVKEVARALTGWTVRRDEFANVDAYHDDGSKKILGRQGKFDGDDVLKILLDHEAVATRIASRLCEMFFGEGIITDQQTQTLAAGLRERDLDVRWAVETILRSELFFADANIGNRVMDPIQFMLTPLRALEILEPPPSTLLLAEWSAKLGQNLFQPPNVFGWPGGRSWLTTRTMIGRANYISTLCNGELHRPNRSLSVKSLAERYGFVEKQDQVKFLSQLLFGDDRQTGDVESMLKSTEAQLG